MPARFAVLYQLDPTALPAILDRLQPDEFEVRGGLALLTWGERHETGDGRAVGTLAGVVCNDLVAAERLNRRGLAVLASEHVTLAMATVGQGGPTGLGTLRWQGSLACMHRAQRTVMVARDPLGVGGLWHRRGPQATMLASDPVSCAALQEGDPAQQVPAGTLALVSETSVTVLPQRPAEENAAWFRHVPDELRHADAAAIEAGLVQRLQEATAAAARGLDGLVRTAPRDAAETWIAARVPVAPSLAPGGLWTLRGCASLFGEAALVERGRVSSAWPRPEPPEPTDGVDPADRGQRWLRVTWLADDELAAERATAFAAGQTLVAPHLDPQVLAWLGGAARGLRPRP